MASCIVPKKNAYGPQPGIGIRKSRIDYGPCIDAQPGVFRGDAEIKPLPLNAKHVILLGARKQGGRLFGGLHGKVDAAHGGVGIEATHKDDGADNINGCKKGDYCTKRDEKRLLFRAFSRHRRSGGTSAFERPLRRGRGRSGIERRKRSLLDARHNPWIRKATGGMATAAASLRRRTMGAALGRDALRTLRIGPTPLFERRLKIALLSDHFCHPLQNTMLYSKKRYSWRKYTSLGHA